MVPESLVQSILHWYCSRLKHSTQYCSNSIANMRRYGSIATCTAGIIGNMQQVQEVLQFEMYSMQQVQESITVQQAKYCNRQVLGIAYYNACSRWKVLSIVTGTVLQQGSRKYCRYCNKGSTEYCSRIVTGKYCKRMGIAARGKY